ncbi:MAG: DeoR family transcriptional regulator [Thermoplasmata archaeon]
MKKSPLTSKVLEELEILERTVDILMCVEKEQPVSISKISSKLRIPEHKVRYSLRMLQKEGIIKPTSGGAVIASNHLDFKNHLEEIMTESDAVIHRLKKILEGDM